MGVIMEFQPRHLDIILELDTLQNDLLERIDDLDRQVSRVLVECNATRNAESAAVMSQ
jgi:hypothetical protein